MHLPAKHLANQSKGGTKQRQKRCILCEKRRDSEAGEAKGPSGKMPTEAGDRRGPEGPTVPQQKRKAAEAALGQVTPANT